MAKKFSLVLTTSLESGVNHALGRTFKALDRRVVVSNGLIPLNYFAAIGGMDFVVKELRELPYHGGRPCSNSGILVLKCFRDFLDRELIFLNELDHYAEEFAQNVCAVISVPSLDEIIRLSSRFLELLSSVFIVMGVVESRGTEVIINFDLTSSQEDWLGTVFHGLEI